MIEEADDIDLHDPLRAVPEAPDLLQSRVARATTLEPVRVIREDRLVHAFQ